MSREVKVALIGAAATVLAAIIGGILVFSFSNPSSNSGQPPVSQSVPWWVILLFVLGGIVVFIIAFLVIGPLILYLRKYFQKFYVPAFSDELPSDIEKVAQVNPGDIQQVVATQLAISSNYYQSVLKQSKQSFLVAIIFAGVGLGFFLAGTAFLIYKSPVNFANPSLIGGALTELLSAINFYLYGRATRQLESFHIRLDGVQRFVIANSVCENLEGEIKQTTRAELVRAMFSNSGEIIDTRQMSYLANVNKRKLPAAKNNFRRNDLQRVARYRATQNNDSSE